MIHFYLFQKINTIVVSDHPKEKIKAKYGPIFEIVNSVKDKSSLDVIKQRVMKSYNKCSFIEDLYVKKEFSKETREKLSQRKLGKSRPDWVREKISKKMKGKSNFEGKSHKKESKIKTAIALTGHSKNSGKTWIYSPTLDKEKRVDDRFNYPEGYRKGRDPDNVNNFIVE